MLHPLPCWLRIRQGGKNKSNHQHRKKMKILNTVHYEVYSEQHRAWWQLTAQFIRSRKLTYAGAQRMIRNGADEQTPSPTASVTRIETAVMQ